MYDVAKLCLRTIRILRSLATSVHEPKLPEVDSDAGDNNYISGNGLCYLFVTQEPLSMSTAKYGYLVGVLKGVRGVCLLVVLPLFKRMNIPYSVIIVISLVSATFSAAFFSVSIYTWMAFVGTSLICTC